MGWESDCGEEYCVDGYGPCHWFAGSFNKYSPLLEAAPGMYDT